MKIILSIILIGMLVLVGCDLPPFGQPFNSSEECPTTISVIKRPRSEAVFIPKLMIPVLNKLINDSIWKIEGNIRTCYQGKYKGQYPNWFYCDDMIVSRWEISSSGTIEYRWYTAVTSEWRPEGDKTNIQQYVFNGFSCENGKKVTVGKEKSSFYVHDSRDGSKINIRVSQSGTETNIEY